MVLRLRPSHGSFIEIDADRTLIGRDKTAEIRLNESSVSRRHATIERRGRDWVITDGGSANGTFVDDVQVAEAVLKDGQTLRLGAAAFKVEIDAPLPPTQTIRPNDADDPRTRPAVPAYNVPTVSPTMPLPQVMSAAQAAELLGVTPGAPAAEVRRQYQRLHNDLQIRITNTPSPSLKRMYQKNLQELRVACEVLAPGAAG
ncbi:MAG TPA: FHA domain-containing protein [Vicinamibacteria bacterium]|nr:FHA domain-containing protein [Vicinamibacteria bacterium]